MSCLFEKKYLEIILRAGFVPPGWGWDSCAGAGVTTRGLTSLAETSGMLSYWEMACEVTLLCAAVVLLDQ